MSKFKLVVLNICDDLGKKVEKHLRDINKNDKNYLDKMKSDRFSNGEGKVSINESVNGSD